MQVVAKYISLKTKGNSQIIDITSSIQEKFEETGLSDGIATIFVQGSTGAVTTLEYEPGLIKDMNGLFERLAPSGAGYAHDATWGDANGHSHLRASTIGPCLIVPFVDGSLTLGTWQQVIFIEFDTRPRSREILIQFMGK